MLTMRWIVILVLALFITACSSIVGPVLEDRQVDYKKQKVAETDLEIPPDLTKSDIGDAMPIPGLRDTATYSQYESNQSNGLRAVNNSEVLPEVANVKVLRDGNQRWLEIQATPEQVWQKVIGFWRENGIILVEQNPSVGVMKTDWLENRADIKQSFITEFLRKALDSVYSAATRDQFRVRLEPSTDNNATNLYLTHVGMQEEMQTSIAGEKENTFWVPRPNDPGLEAEMLRRIMLYLGVAEQTAGAKLAQMQKQQQSRSTIEKSQDGDAALLIKGDTMDAWRLVGIAVERIGFDVEDRDRSAGTYYIGYDDPNQNNKPGFFSRLAFWSDDKQDSSTKHRLQLKSVAESTRVTVLDSQGQPDKSETAVRILTLLQEQIH